MHRLGERTVLRDHVINRNAVIAGGLCHDFLEAGRISDTLVDKLLPTARQTGTEKFITGVR